MRETGRYQSNNYQRFIQSIRHGTYILISVEKIKEKYWDDNDEVFDDDMKIKF